MPNTFNCGNTGANIVTLSAVDGSGNQAACTATVTVEDTIPPTVLCKDATISLDNGGNVTLTSGDVDNGSSDNCGNISFTFSGQSSFDCNGTGTITATLIVSDANENSASCTSSVTITDDSQPTAVCQDVTLMLDGSGNATLTTSQADNGSSDNCSGLSYSLSQSSYNCSNLGESTVVLTVTDDNSNIATCGSIISVQDNIAPTATCNATTAYLDGTGTVSYTHLRAHET